MKEFANHQPNSRPANLSYRAAAVGVSALLFGPTRLSISGRENLPERGPILLAYTHHNSWDVPATAIAVWRTIKQPVEFVGKEEFFDHPRLGPLFKSLGALAINRDRTDFSQIKSAAQVLRDGGILGVAPEAGRVHGRDVTNIRPTVGLVAVLGGAEITPVGVAGRQDIHKLRPRAMQLHFEPPIKPLYRLPAENDLERYDRMAALPAEAIGAAQEIKVRLKTAMQSALDEAMERYSASYGHYPQLLPEEALAQNDHESRY